MTTPMTCDQFADHLADYLEGDMDATTRVAMETHASSCAECGALLADLRKLTVNASSLPALSPSRDLWAGIAARIETPVVELKSAGTAERQNGNAERRTNRTSRVWIGLAAAGLVAITATVTHELTKRSVATPAIQTVAAAPKPEATAAPRPTAAAPTSDSASSESPSSAPSTSSASTTRLASSKPSAEQTYTAEISRLRTVLARRRPQLDSSTVAVVEHNLQVIDDAIAQCRRALQRDPASRFLMESLNDALDTKVQLLRTAATLPSTT